MLEYFNACDDSQIISKFQGKTVEIFFRDGTSKIGVITNFMKAAVYGDSKRTISGIIVDGEREFAIPSHEVVRLSILSK